MSHSQGLAQVGRELWLDLLTLIWPTACVGCSAPDRDLCDACVRRLEQETATVQRREVRLEAGASIPVFAAGAYDDVLRAMLIALKHQGRLGFARRLGMRLALPLRAALDVCDPDAGAMIVCVPSRAAKVRERGYRHVELIVTHALRCVRRDDQLGDVRMRRALRALRGRTGQVGLSAAERQRNAARVAVRSAVVPKRGRGVRCVRATQGLRGRETVVVDDIMTSGATIRASCQVLVDAGIRVAAVVTLGVVERQDGSDAGASAEGENAV